MDQVIQYITNETLRSKILVFMYALFTGWFQLSKANVAWWVSIIVGLLAAANYIDQIIQRRKNKK